MSEAETLQCVDAVLARHRPFTRIWVAYSGGLDSHVLLHWLARGNRSQRLPVAAVHVLHGLQQGADDWAAHCGEVCRHLQVPLRVERVTVDRAAGESPEEAARRARYACLSKLLAPGEVVATAHHLDDQCETVLLQLARGAGIPGLAAMPECLPLGHGRVLRPLLERGREELTAYARRHALGWVTDPSNRDQRFDRNYLRQRIVPAMKARWPGLSRNLARSARNAGEARTLLQALADLDLERVQLGPHQSLLLAPLLELSGPRQRNLVRRWIGRLSLPMPATRHLEELFRSVVHARSDRQPHLRWPGVEIRRFRDELHAMRPLPSVARCWSVPVELGAAIDVPGGGVVELRVLVTGRLSCRRLAGKTLEIGFRRPGGRLRLARNGPRRQLKSLFQEAGVPPWMRERTPMLFADGDVVAVAGLWTNAEFETDGDRTGAELRWQNGPSFGSLASPCE